MVKLSNAFLALAAEHGQVRAVPEGDQQRGWLWLRGLFLPLSLFSVVIFKDAWLIVLEFTFHSKSSDSLVIKTSFNCWTVNKMMPIL